MAEHPSGILPIRQVPGHRRDAAAADQTRSVQVWQFTHALRPFPCVRHGAPEELLRSGRASIEDAALAVGIRYETIGLLVCSGIMPLSLMAELTGAVALDLWSKMYNWVLLVRKEQSRDHFLEWFQWLVEQLQKARRHEQMPAYVGYRDWSPPK